ncbi:hypothetical protein BP5796_04979 [Coleophoma crateriformis]|uniref:Uncharacterized protein n=1 Tax=Coleophoma crateriformis TaxID=565419 RepID=A0A3D8SCJ1_9HELO|nr:hypothetical protein BP5796_04979 [Coleophoma crateriformis]
MGVFTKVVKFLEVKPKGEAYAAYPPTRWGNRDIYPIIAAERTYQWYDFFAYWFTAGIALSGWTLGSSLVAIGLTAGQALGAVLLGASFASLNAFLCGEMGRQHYIGYTMMGRATWGLYGSYLCIFLSVVQSLIYFGIQSFYGGQATVLLLNAIFPSFLRMKNTLPASAGITTPNLIGFLVFMAIFAPIVAVPPHKLGKLLLPVFACTCVTFAGVLGWALHANGGPGNLVAPAIAITPLANRYAFVSGISQVAGAYTGGSVRLSDWTRFTATPQAPRVGMVIAQPLSLTIGALVGVLVTSATYELILEWNPLLILQYVQTIQYTPACRAGTFFAGLGFLASQLFVNLTQNCVSTGMDLAGSLPRFITLRRGGFIVCIVGVVIQPWRFLGSAATFLSVIGTFAVFLAPMTAILVTDYWLIRRRKVKIPDLYRADGIFWYHYGLNWKAFLVFFCCIAPSFPGLINSVNGMHISIGLQHFFSCTYFFGYTSAVLLFWGISTIFPPPGNRIMEKMDDDLIEGVGPTDLEVASIRGSQLDGVEKAVATPEVKSLAT